MTANSGTAHLFLVATAPVACAHATPSATQAACDHKARRKRTDWIALQHLNDVAGMKIQLRRCNTHVAKRPDHQHVPAVGAATVSVNPSTANAVR